MIRKTIGMVLSLKSFFFFCAGFLLHPALVLLPLGTICMGRRQRFRAIVSSLGRWVLFLGYNF
jgi:hypothetical protein